MLKFTEVKIIDPKLTQNEKAYDLGVSDSIFRIDISMHSPFHRNNTKNNSHRQSRTSSHVKPGKCESENRTLFGQEFYFKNFIIVK